MINFVPAMTALKFAWEKREWIAGGILAIVACWFIWSWNERGNERDEWKKTAVLYEDALKAEREWNAQVIDTLERKQENDKERSDFEASQMARNQADRAAGDGPLAPVLYNGFHQLYKRQAKHRDKNS